MNTRIRYSKEADGSLISMKVIKSYITPEEYRVRLLSDGKTGVVTALNTGVDTVVKAATLHKVKIAVKSMLEDLGCPFAKETRER